MTNIVWLRNDLRLHDNPALNEACKAGNPLAIYILESKHIQTRARDWWLHHSLKSLEIALLKQGIPLLIFKGDAEALLPQIATEQKAQHVFWNRRYTERGIKTDKTLKEYFKDSEIACVSCKGNLLFEPWEISNKQGTFFKVFTPMFKEMMTRHIPQPENFTLPKTTLKKAKTAFACTLNDLNLINTQKTWHHNFENMWQVGEQAASDKLLNFLESKATQYKEKRDFPIQSVTSTLSPHLHFGEISPREIFAQTDAFQHNQNLEGDIGIHTFKSEVVWREFSYQQLFHYDNIEKNPINKKFTEFPWEENEVHLKAWQQGQTGIPIVDAGMRELWHTGTMHNRVRMIVASLLTKNLLMPWQEGATWFMDTLLDADEASNSASWQWVAGCGLDASPYFRIFNPVTQGERFDTKGDYVKKWVPELKDLDSKYIHKPWEATAMDLTLANIKLGDTYPKPIVNLKTSRARALDAYKHIKNLTNP
jgi:deoxyribodipyrimidine photo-lyase